MRASKQPEPVSMEEGLLLLPRKSDNWLISQRNLRNRSTTLSVNSEIIKVNEAIKGIDSEITDLDNHKVLIESSADSMTSFAEENAEQANLTSDNVAKLHDMVDECTIMTRKVVNVSEELVGYIREFKIS